MGEKLRRPPLLEALCDFRFKTDGPWDWTVPGMLYERIGDRFSEREDVRKVTVNIDVHKGSPPVSHVAQVPDGIRFKKPDGSALVQCGPYFLGVKHLRPYSCWEDFRTMILDVFHLHRDVLQGVRLDRIGLRYINQIPIVAGTSTRNVISIFPEMPEFFDKEISAFFQRYEVRFDGPPAGTLILQTGTHRVGDNDFMMLDLDHVSCDVERLADPENLTFWLDAVHDRLYEGFVASLAKEQYLQFKEEA